MFAYKWRVAPETSGMKGLIATRKHQTRPDYTDKRRMAVATYYILLDGIGALQALLAADCAMVQRTRLPTQPSTSKTTFR